MPNQDPIQIVFVKWGTKYSAAYVNALVEATLRHTSRPVEFVCFTDDPTGIDARVDIRPFPDFGVPIETMTGRGGSLPKMSMFMRGALKPDVPTIYIDLDSSIMGDVARLARCLESRRGVYMLQRHAIPHWRIRQLVRLLFPDRYYLANTAVTAFYPGDLLGIADRFLVDFPRYLAAPQSLDPLTRSLYDEGNERIISHATRDESRVFPRDVAIKFTQEYMSPILLLAELKDRLPQVRARRARQVVISYQGDAMKPEQLLKARPGEVVTYKHYKTRWSYDRISDYWRNALSGVPTTTNPTHPPEK